MRVILQKSGKAEVKVDREIIGQINKGLVIFLGITHDDKSSDIDYLVDKICNLRLFEKDKKYFEESLLEINGEALVISQFTLYASCKKGRRPDFIASAKKEIAEPLYEEFIRKLSKKNIKVEKGVFGAIMKVNLSNNGPVTIILDS